MAAKPIISDVLSIRLCESRLFNNRLNISNLRNTQFKEKLVTAHYVEELDRPWRGLEAFVSESVAEFVFRSAISPNHVVKAKLKKLRRGKKKSRVENLKTNRALECGAVCKRI
ncbi:hypothetical protein ALC53_02565 [Atta colombica]|uniref:Uncharacterized protein n=1 Tax=Atta colombica TaxID=520822 RepID=A0A195BS07_9HYME|nr:hypothetical protein ALC53_02565 [Atta colombica]